MIKTDDAGTMITGESIDLYRFLAAIRGLALEINTGLKVSSKVNMSKVATSFTGEPYRTRKQALAGLVEAAERVIDGYERPASVVRALSK